MRVEAAALAGGIFGVLGTLCFLVAFATDYWLLASDNCETYTIQNTPTWETNANATEVGQIISFTSCLFLLTQIQYILEVIF